MNKGKIYEHLHGLGLNGEQSLRVLQLIGREVLAEADRRISDQYPRSYRNLNVLLTQMGEQEGLIFDEQQTERRCTDTASGN